MLWLVGGLVVFLLAAVMLAPPTLVLRGLGLTLAAMVPAIVVVVLARDSRRRSDVYGGHTPDDPSADPDHEAEH